MENFLSMVLVLNITHNSLKINRCPLCNIFLIAHICRACWNFLVENFNQFPKIAPMKELMKPFQTKIKVWTQSYELFNEFDSHAGEFSYSLIFFFACIFQINYLYSNYGMVIYTTFAGSHGVYRHLSNIIYKHRI